MGTHIDFYFDFSSAYSAIGRLKIAELAARHGRELRWHAISLGVIFRDLRHAPPAANTPKGRYLRHDVERCAREAGMHWRWPEPFPFNSIPAARGFHWLMIDQPARAVDFTHAIFDAGFSEGRSLSTPHEVAGIGGEIGLDAEALIDGMRREDVKARLRDVTNDAVIAGVFGAPTFIVDGEMFWGADRLAQLDRWLRQGGW